MFWLRNKKWGPANGVMGWPAVCACGISIFTLKFAYLDLESSLKDVLQTSMFGQVYLFILDLPDIA